MKKCKTCGETKPLTEFGKQKATKDGYTYKCKSCMSEYNRQWREENKETVREYNRQWREENRERIKQYRQENRETAKEYNKQYRQENRETVREYNRQWREENREYNRQYYQENKEAILERRRRWREENKKSKIRNTGGNMISLKEQFNIERAFELGLNPSEMKVWYYLDKMGGKVRTSTEIHVLMSDEMMSERTVHRGVISLVFKNLVSDDRVGTNQRPSPIRGVYTISRGDNVYVGQSKDVIERWNSHKCDISSGTHTYFKNTELEELTFDIVHECVPEKLLMRELLLAQKLKSEGKTVLNEDNFTLL
jgi:hypothetical protein